LTGCGQNGVKGLVPASGTIEYDGKPMGGICIVLTPTISSPSVYIGTAVSNENGIFTIRTLEQYGILPGNYNVSFSKTTSITTSDSGNQDPNAMDYTPPVIITKQELPDQYLSSETSGITVTIPSTGDQNIRFQLKPGTITHFPPTPKI
jgi:5-hydroxyisourate hydrolase-like protein (transthyretin family)